MLESKKDRRRKSSFTLGAELGRKFQISDCKIADFRFGD
jgi:hypothetical protein